MKRISLTLLVVIGLCIPIAAFSLNNLQTAPNYVTSVDVAFDQLDYGATDARKDDPGRKYIGERRCRRLFEETLTDNDDVVFTFNLGGQAAADFNAYLLDPSPADQGSVSCDDDNPESCLNLQDERQVDIQQTGGAIRVTMPFDRLVEGTLTRADCRAAPYETSTQALGPPETLQATDVSVGDAMASDTGEPDTVTDTAAPADGPVGQETDFVVRLTFQTNETADTQPMVDAAVRVDLRRPPQPELVDAGASENNLKVKWRFPNTFDDIQDYYVFYSNEPLEGESPLEIAQSAETFNVWEFDDNDDPGEVRTDEININQAAGNQLYVGITSFDYAENYSTISSTDSALEVKQSIDYWDKYRASGGSETGGGGCSCGTKSRGPLALLNLLFLLGIVGCPLWISRNV